MFQYSVDDLQVQLQFVQTVSLPSGTVQTLKYNFKIVKIYLCIKIRSQIGFHTGFYIIQHICKIRKVVNHCYWRIGLKCQYGLCSPENGHVYVS
jgi:hypothetical protein